jgi:hypothetical protein
VEALVGEHVPQGPTEEHLVEEIAGIVWRKRRLRLAEAAAHRRGLEDTLEPYRSPQAEPELRNRRAGFGHHEPCCDDPQAASAGRLWLFDDRG